MDRLDDSRHKMQYQNHSFMDVGGAQPLSLAKPIRKLTSDQISISFFDFVAEIDISCQRLANQ